MISSYFIKVNSFRLGHSRLVLLSRFILAGIIFFAVSGNALAQINSGYADYISRYKNIAIEEMRKHGIPASITLAQGLLESGGGTSMLAVRGNNHFGIKCGRAWNGRTLRKDDDYRNECFRAYNDVIDSFEDHSRFLKKDRYRKLFSLSKKDYKGWARGLKECGYATSPTYADRLISLIETYRLYEYDDDFVRNEAIAAKEYEEQPRSEEYFSLSSVRSRMTINNGVPCVLTKPGDTWQGLARITGKSVKKLRKYNEVGKNEPLQYGQFIYADKKKKKADRKLHKRWHKINAGESMHDISQLYGIRVKSLYKMNFKDQYYVPRMGDLLKIR